MWIRGAGGGCGRGEGGVRGCRFEVACDDLGGKIVWSGSGVS